MINSFHYSTLTEQQQLKLKKQKEKKNHFIIQKQLLERSSAQGIGRWTQHIMDGSLHTSGSAAGKSRAGMCFIYSLVLPCSSDLYSQSYRIMECFGLEGTLKII